MGAAGIEINKQRARLVKSIPDRFCAWLPEMLRNSAFLGWAAENFEGDSRNLAGMFLHKSVLCGYRGCRTGNGNSDEWAALGCTSLLHILCDILCLHTVV